MAFVIYPNLNFGFIFVAFTPDVISHFFFLGPEYGTMEAAWKGMLVEADRLSDLHIKVKDNLCMEVIQNIKTWQKDTYHKVS